MKRTGLRREKPLRATPREHHDPALPKHGPRLRRESPERAQQMRVYRHRRLLFLAEHNYVCESPWPCGRPATTVQHRMGRRGWRLLAEQWWAASCWLCNVGTEQDGLMAAQAQASNWKVSPDFTGRPEDVPIIPIADLAWEAS